MGQYSRLGKNTALVFIGSAGSKLLNLFMLPFYTRWLTAADYGSVDLINTYAGLALGVVSCSIFDAIFIFPKDQPRQKQTRYFSSALAFWVATLAVTASVCAAIDLIGRECGIHGFIVDYIWYIFAILAVTYIQSISQQFLRAIDKMAIYSSTGIALTLAMIGLSFLLIPRGGVKGFIAALVLANVISVAYSFISARLWRYIDFKTVSRPTLGEMLRYSVPLIPNGIMWFLINFLNRPLLESWTGVAAIGILAVAGRFPNLLNTVYLLFQNAWLISVMEEAKKPTYTDFYNKMLKGVVMIQSLLAVALAFCGKWIIEIFTTPEFYSAWAYIPLLVVGVIFMNVATFVGSNFAVTRESKFYFYSTVWAGASSVALNFALIPSLGLWGACWSMVLSQAICMVARIIYSWKTVKITGLRFYILNSIFLTAGVAAPIFVKSPTAMAICAVAIAVYFIAVNHAQIITLKEKIQSIYELKIKHHR